MMTVCVPAGSRSVTSPVALVCLRTLPARTSAPWIGADSWTARTWSVADEWVESWAGSEADAATESRVATTACRMLPTRSAPHVDDARHSLIEVTPVGIGEAADQHVLPGAQRDREPAGFSRGYFEQATVRPSWTRRNVVVPKPRE